MKMYAVIDTEHPEVSSLTSFFRERELAEKHIAGCTKHTAGGEFPGSTYLEIQEVERESNPCKLCGGESTAKHPEKYPYCRNCHYVGAAEEDLRSEQIYAFRIAFPDAEVGIEHTGGGCFWLAFRWEDDEYYYIATAGESTLPCDEEGHAIRDGWGYVGRMHDDEDHPEYEIGKDLFCPDDLSAFLDAYPKDSISDGRVIELILVDRARRAA